MEKIKIKNFEDLKQIKKGDWFICRSKFNPSIVYQGVVLDIAEEKDIVAFSSDKEFCSSKNIIVFTLFQQSDNSNLCKEGFVKYIQSGRHIQNYFNVYDFEYMKETDAFFEFALYGNEIVMKALQ